MVKTTAKRVSPLGPGALVRDLEQNLQYLPAKMQGAYLPPTSCRPVAHDVVQSLVRAAPTLPPAPGRKVSPRGRRSHRGIAQIWCPGQAAFRQVWHESLLELHVLWLLAIRADFHDVQEQVGPVSTSGELRHSDAITKKRAAVGDHYYDYVVNLADGTRVACAVKPAVKADAEFRQFEGRRAQNLDPAVADTVLLITDRDFRAVDAVNAGRLLAEDRFDDPEAERAVLECVSGFTEPRMVFQIVESSGLGARAYSAVLRNIRWRRLRVLSPGVIDTFSVVGRVGYE